MVNLWLILMVNSNGYGDGFMMVNDNLVGGFSPPTPLKNDGLKVSWDFLKFPEI